MSQTIGGIRRVVVFSGLGIKFQVHLVQDQVKMYLSLRRDHALKKVVLRLVLRPRPVWSTTTLVVTYR